MKRRDFLAAASTMMLPLTVSGFGFKSANRNSPVVQSLLKSNLLADDRVLVIVYLNGGNDGLNTVIPVEHYSRYQSLRSNIAIPENQVLKLASNPETGLHPAMSGMREMYDSGKLAIIHSVAYPNPDQSHYRSTDIWMTGVESNQYSETGWIGRYLDGQFPGYPENYPNPSMDDPLAIQIGYVNTKTLLGPSQPMNVTIENPSTFYQFLGTIPSATSGTLPCCDAGKRVEFIRNQQALAVSYSTEIKRAADAGKNLATYPAGVNDLSEQLKIVARLIHGGLRSKIYFVELRGFDTHATQVNTSDTLTGTHAQLLRLLSEAISAFQNDLKLQGTENHVMGMTFSDFGRRANSNASMGTDHGVAAPMFAFGTGIKRQLVGINPNLTSDLDPPTTTRYNNNQNIKMQIDFRRVYTDFLKDWLGTPSDKTNSILYKNFPTTSLFSDTVYSLGSGMWPDQSIWSSGRMPGPKDIVVINSGHSISVGQDITAKSIQVEGNGELNLLGNYKVTTS
ncbi:Uncharacterized conserved protein, DUF1501 family [Dyadobacter soli]|uniref:Uncharacterized conserved protein, DUF1501 family n=1 Tax=Dyadobacter soli TaxID=659014 RepID=A0A1G6YCH7_9BACT|nr:DUF1501 domain-containing protein [Dyadobacter soli]SDD88032.1 Uncharacterized conserved protein, DUF1501 family [Dyadobacter soli]